MRCRWKDVSDPKSDDWIAIYMADADPSEKAPVQYFEAGTCPTHEEFGYGSVKYVQKMHHAQKDIIRNFWVLV